MNITTISLNSIWEEHKANLDNIDFLLEKLSKFNIGDIVVLPEMFATGFTSNASVADEDGTILNWMQSRAALYNIALVGSVAIKVSDKYYNRLYFVKPDRKYNIYDKKHLFSLGGESKLYSKGERFSIVNYMGFNIALSICYDIRFPVWSRNEWSKNSGYKYDILLNVASFPKVRIGVIEHLLKARAIENLSYALFVNRDGVDPLLSYSASSLIVDYKGNTISQSSFFNDKYNFPTQILTATFNLADLENFRLKFPVHLDWD